MPSESPISRIVHFPLLGRLRGGSVVVELATVLDDEVVDAAVATVVNVSNDAAHTVVMEARRRIPLRNLPRRGGLLVVIVIVATENLASIET